MGVGMCSYSVKQYASLFNKPNIVVMAMWLQHDTTFIYFFNLQVESCVIKHAPKFEREKRVTKRSSNTHGRGLILISGLNDRLKRDVVCDVGQASECSGSRDILARLAFARQRRDVILALGRGGSHTHFTPD